MTRHHRSRERPIVDGDQDSGPTSPDGRWYNEPEHDRWSFVPDEWPSDPLLNLVLDQSERRVGTHGETRAAALEHVAKDLIAQLHRILRESAPQLSTENALLRAQLTMAQRQVGELQVQLMRQPMWGRLTKDNPDRLTEGDAADYLGISAATLRNWRFRGEGPAFVRIGAAVRYERNDLNAFGWCVSTPPESGVTMGWGRGWVVDHDGYPRGTPGGWWRTR